MTIDERLERLERQVNLLHRIIAMLCEHRHGDGPKVICIQDDAEVAGNCTLSELKARAIMRALHRTDGNKMAAARLLGINVKTLYNLIRKHT